MSALSAADTLTTALAASVEARAGDDVSKPVRLRLLPMGNFSPRDARINAFSIKDKAHAQEIVDASRAYAGAQDVPVDYDHQSVYSAVQGVGGVAPAAGWIDPQSLTVQDDGIYGDVKWTDRAAAAIKGREYRYLSPVISHDKNGRVQRLLSVGLTNQPAVDGLAKLAASIQPSKENQMDLTALAASLGLPATATVAEILAAQQAEKAALSAATADANALRTALGATDQTAALSTVATLKASGDGSTALMASLQADVVRLSTERNERIVDDAVRGGKIMPAQREHYLTLMRTDEKTALALIGSAPVIIAPGQTITGQPKGAGVTALSAEQKQVAALCGMSEADMLKAVQEEGQ